MPQVYKVITNEGRFVAFWKQDEQAFCFFRPDDTFQPYFERAAADWHEVRSAYEGRDPSQLASYDDTINAAWHFLGLSGLYLDKNKVCSSYVDPGIYYPRIWRGYRSADNPFFGYNAINARLRYDYKYIQSCTAVGSLFGYLGEIFRHIEPARENMKTYGHKIRELLILICTEIESGWRAVLDENTGAGNHRDRYTTVDYFKVKEPLRLGDWGVALTDYPHVGSYMPFDGWSRSASTKSLPWYEAYNEVKHNRELSFVDATMEHLLNAAAALHILQSSQWGPEIYSRLHDNQFSPFHIVKYVQ